MRACRITALPLLLFERPRFPRGCESVGREARTPRFVARGS